MDLLGIIKIASSKKPTYVYSHDEYNGGPTGSKAFQYGVYTPHFSKQDYPDTDDREYWEDRAPVHYTRYNDNHEEVAHLSTSDMNNELEYMRLSIPRSRTTKKEMLSNVIVGATLGTGIPMGILNNTNKYQNKAMALGALGGLAAGSLFSYSSKKRDLVDNKEIEARRASLEPLLNSTFDKEKAKHLYD